MIDAIRRPGGGGLRPRRLVESLLVVAAPVIVGGVSGALTSGSISTWYRALDKPWWNPPDWVFGPVWTALYVSMGIALLQVWQLDRTRPEVRLALLLFALQLALNFGWSWIFFEQRALGLAFAEILALHVSIMATIVAFGRLRRSAGLILLPYLAWTTFAAVLNGTIWQLNR